MKTILLIGANSFVGKELVETLKGKHNIIGTYLHTKNNYLKSQEKLDITRKEEVLEILKRTKPDIVILLSAISTNKAPKEKIRRVNIGGTLNIISSIKELHLNPKIIFFSTEQVFDGKKGRYLETDIPNPINDYGKSKLEAEKAIKKHKNYLILRCSLILGKKREGDHDNFISSFIEAKEKLKIFKKVYRTPIYIKDVGKIMAELIRTNQKGILNISGDKYLSFLEMAEKIEKAFNLKKEHEVVEGLDDLIPKKLGLKNDKLKKIIDFDLTGFQEMLIEIKNEMRGIP